MSTAEAIIILIAVTAGALVKAVTGMGFPLVAIPVISLFVSVETAVVVIALPNVTSNAVLGWRERAAWPDTRDLTILIPTSIVGAVLGTLLLVSLPERVLVLALAGAVLGYVASRIRHPDLVIGPVASRRWSAPVGVLAGLFQGAVGVSGPVVGSWIHAYRLPRPAHVLSITMLFLFAGAAQLSILTADGQYDRQRLMATAAAMVPALAMIPIGTRIRDRLSSRAFDTTVLVLLACSSGALLLRGLT